VSASASYPALSLPAERIAQRALAYPMRLAGLHSCYLRTSYGRFHYYDSMPGSSEPPAVMLHGLGALGISLFGLGALLRRRRRVVMPDLFHFLGLSEPLASRLDTGEHVEAILEFIHGLHVDAFDVCGHSAGGGAAVLVALRMPTRARSLVLLNPGGLSFDFETLREDILSVDRDEGARRVYEKLACRGILQLPLVREIGARTIGGMFARTGVRDYLGTVRTIDFVDSVFRDLCCPTLLLWGDGDRILPREIALHIAAETPNVQAYWIKGGSHLLPIDDPYTVYEHLLRFWGIERPPRRGLRRLVPLFARVRPAEAIAP
jgi:pimeloyl-ACP methyl ester carboxylesterase